jgi:hypothetical protein
MDRWMNPVPHQINRRLQLPEIPQLAFFNQAIDETVDPIQVLGILLQKFIRELVPLDLTPTPLLQILPPPSGLRWVKLKLNPPLASCSREAEASHVRAAVFLRLFQPKKPKFVFVTQTSLYTPFFNAEVRSSKRLGTAPRSLLFAGECTPRYDSR